jgi:hypothetical protein
MNAMPSSTNCGSNAVGIKLNVRVYNALSSVGKIQEEQCIVPQVNR